MNAIPRLSKISAAAGLVFLAAGHGLAANANLPATLDLRGAIGYALDSNFAIRQARERIRQQEGVVLQVSSRQIPTVSATGSYQRNSSDLSAGFPPTNSAWTLDLGATQTLFSGGGIRASTRRADQGREAAMLDLQNTINESLLEVRINFYKVLLAREQVDVQEQNLALLEEQQKTINDRFSAGTVSSFEPLRASVAVANARVPLVTARNDLRLAIENLRLSLGLEAGDAAGPGELPEIQGQLEYAPTAFELQSSIESARRNRPDLARLSRLVAAQEESLNAVRATRLPSVALVGGWQLRNGTSGSFGDSRDGVYLGLRSQWDIFDGKSRAGQIAQARSALEQLRIQSTQASLAAEVEVRSAFSSYQEATELAEVSSQVVGQAEEALRLATARYSAGTATQLDTLQSQVDLTTARTNQAQAYYNFNVAVARLRKAAGLSDPFYVE